LSGTLNTGLAWYLSGGSMAATLRTRWTLDRRFADHGRVALSYAYSASPAGLQPGLLDSGRHTVSLSGSGKVKDASVSVSLSRDLGGDREYGTLSLRKPLPFGRDAAGQPLWTFEASHLFSRFEEFNALSTQLSLNRIFGRYRASLCYSPQGAGSYATNRPWISPYGVGYTYSGGKHLWIEFSAATQ
jgi:hypothetical protein